MAQLIRRQTIERSVCLGRERGDVLRQLRRKHLAMRELLDRIMPLCESEDDEVLSHTHTTIDAIESLLESAEQRWDGLPKTPRSVVDRHVEEQLERAIPPQSPRSRRSGRLNGAQKR